MKTIFKITALAALMVGVTQMAHAAGSNDSIEITGNITPYSCDLSVPTATLNLGNHAAAEFGSTGKDNTVGAKEFMVSVAGCTGKMKTADDPLTIQVIETGTPNKADALNFYGDDNGTNAGIVLSMKGGAADADGAISPKNPTYVIYKAAANDDDLTGKQFAIAVTAAMKAVAVPSVGALKANLQFTMVE